MLISDDGLRAMYSGGRADAAARRFARLWGAGRRSGRVTRFPLGMARVGDQWYLVSMLGERCNWVQNVRAADGRATLLHRRATPCQLVEVPVSERAPIIKRYLARVPGARPHVPVGRHAPLADFESIAARYPVFRVVPVPALARRADRAARSGRRHHWWRWVIAAAAAVVVLGVL